MDPYQILGVARDATPEQIKEARNFLVSGLHPDRFEPGSKHWHLANEKLKDINAAYKILSDPAQRAAYDAGTASPTAEEPEASAETATEAPLAPQRRTVWFWFATAILLVAVSMLMFFRAPQAPNPSPSASGTPSPVPSVEEVSSPAPASPAGTNAVESIEFKGHSAAVISVAASGDGKYLVSGSQDLTVRYWERESGKLLETVTIGAGFANNVWSVAVSVDGKFALVGLQRPAVELRELPSLKLVRSLTGHTSATYGVAFSPDGRWAAGACYDHTVTVWELASGKVLKQFRHGEQAKSVAFSPDGRWLATGSRDHHVRLIDTKTWMVRELKGHAAAVHGVAFAPDSKSLVSADQAGRVHQWEVNLGKAIKVLSLANDRFGRVTFSADGKLIVAGSDMGKLACWNAQTGAYAGDWQAFDAGVGWVGAVPQTDLLVTTGGKIGGIKLWDLRLRPGKIE